MVVSSWGQPASQLDGNIFYADLKGMVAGGGHMRVVTGSEYQRPARPFREAYQFMWFGSGIAVVFYDESMFCESGMRETWSWLDV